jgi:hypothetical protein
VKFSSKTAMTILLMLLVAVEWLFASLPLEFFFFWLPFDFDESHCLSSLFVGPCFQFENDDALRLLVKFV